MSVQIECKNLKQQKHICVALATGPIRNREFPCPSRSLKHAPDGAAWRVIWTGASRCRDRGASSPRFIFPGKAAEKEKMKKIRMVILAAGMVFVFQLLHAQTAVVGSYDTDLGPVQAAPDTIVSLTAEQDGLAQVPFDQLPRFGTFWLVMSGPGGNIAPFPCPPLDAYFPVYDITGEGRQFLVDGSSAGPGASSALRFGPLSTSSGRLAALTAQAGAVQKVVDKIQGIAANQQMRTMARAMGMDRSQFWRWRRWRRR